MRNTSNLPYLITITLFITGLLLLFISESLVSSVYILLITVSVFCLRSSIVLAYTICPIGLIFQFLHKNKTVFDKWILGLNLTGVIFAVTLLIFVLIAFPNSFKGEKDVRRQIAAEQKILNKEYQPVLDYLSDYKKKHGVYPANIDSVAPKSELFDKYEYNLTKDNKGYWLRVYTVNQPVEYYYNDEFEDRYNWYDGDGKIDGFLDNNYYYQIDDKWHAIMLQHFTRHSKIFGKIERYVDTRTKENAEKFVKK